MQAKAGSKALADCSSNARCSSNASYIYVLYSPVVISLAQWVIRYIVKQDLVEESLCYVLTRPGV